ncbi:unnamed protein product [Linum trigynum]|uniref:Uncharacterized protein n=1 Tax=Linum trigynum TaxID=586398 RepID=A0AAV2D581_9ROSI
MHFLMKFRPEYEGIRASLLHRNVTKVEDVLGELVREESRLRSQAKIDFQAADSSPAAFVAGPTTGPVYAAAPVQSNALPLTQDAIRQMLQEVVRDALPSALGSVFTVGQENGEGDRPRD